MPRGVATRTLWWKPRAKGGRTVTAIETRPTLAEAGVTATYRAAVVHDFAEPLARRGGSAASARARADPGAGRGDGAVPHRHPCRARRLAGEADAALRPRPRGRRHRRGARHRRDGGRDRRPRRDAVARLRLRDVRLLRLRLGDALPRAEEHGLLDRRRLRRVRDRVRALRRQGARGDRPVRRRAAHVRRRHDVQGDQGRRARARPTSWRSSASAGSVTWRSSTPRSRAAGSSPST